MDIYIDILFMENLLINYTILLISQKILNKQIMPIKIFQAAIIGSVYVVLMLLFPNLHVFYTVISKIFLSILMVLIAFWPSSVADFLKTICVFYVSTFIMAGSMLFFIYLNKKGGIVKNGVIYVLEFYKFGCHSGNFNSMLNFKGCMELCEI